jgi:hypothetical protein
LSIDPENVEEKYRITVTNPVGNTFKVMFINPNYDPDNKNSVQQWTSDAISDNDSASTMRRRIVNYYYSIWGSNVSVERIDYDADDIETDDDSLVVKRVYTVTVLRMINGPSFSMAIIQM